MPTQNPRLTITLKPSTAALMRRMSEITGNSQSALIAELLEANEPVFERLVTVLQAAQEAKAALTEETKAGLDQAQARIEKQLGLALEALDVGTRSILEEAEAIKRRKAKRASVRAPEGPRRRGEAGDRSAATPPSNRGVRLRNPKAKVRKTGGNRGPV